MAYMRLPGAEADGGGVKERCGGAVRELGPTPHTAGLFSMWVAPEARGRRVGVSLFNAVKTWARGEGYQRILLDVTGGHISAQRLYSLCGFTRTGKAGTRPPSRQYITEHELSCDLSGSI